jgi:uncharacterized phage-associated protein
VGCVISDFDFNPCKAGQVAAFFVSKEGGLLNVVKLIKLIYLANRAFMAAYDEPMFMDRFVSMPLGPVNSRTYECVNAGAQGWDEFISDKANHDVGLARDVSSESDLDELSEADLEVLADTWKKFGHMDQWQLVKYTHDSCPEWEDPYGSSSPIPYARIFKFLGKERPNRLDEKIIENRRIAAVLARGR